MNNVTFKENHSYAGGAIYLNNINSINNSSTLIDIYKKNTTYYQNIVESHGNDIATGPRIVNLLTTNSNKIELLSGEHHSLQFNLTDEFNNTIFDIAKYYSNVFLTLDFEDQNEYLNNKIIGNSGYFSKGNLILLEYLL